MAGSVQSHRDLIVWQKSMQLVREVYHLAARFPTSENYCLTAQITRAAASVPAHIDRDIVARRHTSGICLTDSAHEARQPLSCSR